MDITDGVGGAQPGEVSAVRAEVQRLIEEGELQTTIAKEAGISPSAFNAGLRARYAAHNGEIERKLARYVESRRGREATVALIPDVGYFETPTSKKIMLALGYAQQTGEMAEVYGAPGMGKTETARRYAATHPNAWLATMAPDAASIGRCLEAICDAIGISTNDAAGARRKAVAVQNHVQRSKGLIIVDEAQHLQDAALEEIRSIHDATRIGIVLMGSHVLHGRFTAKKRIVNTAQLTSRIGIQIKVLMPQADDIAALLDAWGVKGETERRMLIELAKLPGALRNLDRTLKMASLVGNGKINVAALKEARRLLEGAE